jgi:hypothetical protein
LVDVLDAQAPAVHLGDSTWASVDLQGVAGAPVQCNGVTTVPLTSNGKTVYLRFLSSEELNSSIAAGTLVTAFGTKRSSWTSDDVAQDPAEFLLPPTGRIAIR